jgi:hypothetical protein
MITTQDVFYYVLEFRDHLCGLVVRVVGYKSRGPGFDSWRYQIFWEVVGLERGRLSLVSTTKELLEWKSSNSGSRKSRLTAVVIHCAYHATPSIHKKLALTSPTGGGHSVGVVLLRAKATEFFFLEFRIWDISIHIFNINEDHKSIGSSDGSWIVKYCRGLSLIL